MGSQTVIKYLAKHAEPEAEIGRSLTGSFGAVLGIPVYDEPAAHLKTWVAMPRPEQGPLLLIAALNARTDSAPEVHAHNEVWLAGVRALFGEGVALPHHSHQFTAPFGTLVVVCRSAPSRALPRKKGVGLARKIAGDIALSTHEYGDIAHPWLYCTDADAVLPADYFERLPVSGPQIRGLAAATYPFDHRGPPGAVADATADYECWLRYQVLGLASAGSPFAMQTIGSTIAVAPESYAAVRGWPRRHGAEDFYLLNKLAKVGAIRRLGGAPIGLTARVSRRIPFGTGPATAKRLEEGLAVPRLYHPDTYRYVGVWMRQLRAFAVDNAPLDAWRNDPAFDPAGQPATEDAPAPLNRQLLQTVLDELDVDSRAQAAVQHAKGPRARLRQVHGWFDALLTLKLIHGLRDHGLGPQLTAVAADELVRRSGHFTERPASTLAGLRTLETATCLGDVGPVLLRP
ncbi:MAG: hypothetical protein KC502_17195 [Myxococcales bacterium]|nr:hypothetical protein [Myxococcales bacterium]